MTATWSNAWPDLAPEQRAAHERYLEQQRARSEAEKARYLAGVAEDLAAARLSIGSRLVSVELGRSNAHSYVVDTCRLTFEDGRVLELQGWGYDEWGLSLSSEAGDSFEALDSTAHM